MNINNIKYANEPALRAENQDYRQTIGDTLNVITLLISWNTI